MLGNKSAGRRGSSLFGAELGNGQDPHGPVWWRPWLWPAVGVGTGAVDSQTPRQLVLKLFIISFSWGTSAMAPPLRPGCHSEEPLKAPQWLPLEASEQSPFLTLVSLVPLSSQTPVLLCQIPLQPCPAPNSRVLPRVLISLMQQKCDCNTQLPPALTLVPWKVGLWPRYTGGNQTQ